MSGTVEISQAQQEDADWQVQRHEEIAAICWQECPNCIGRGYIISHWEADDTGPEHILRLTCANCDGQGDIQLQDPWRVEALYDAADDAREKMGVWCYTRIASALAMAVRGGVTCDESKTTLVESETTKGKSYLISHNGGCNCLDAYHRAPKINDIPHCKHQIAVLLVKAAEHKMYDQEPTRYGSWSDVLDGLMSVQEADRREAQGR